MELGYIGCSVWKVFTWLRIGTGGGCCECGDEPPDSGPTDLFSRLVVALGQPFPHL
jgi:hypothetical protein